MKLLKKEVTTTDKGMLAVGIAIDGDNYEEAYEVAKRIAHTEYEDWVALNELLQLL